jgi:hypothetical protein
VRLGARRELSRVFIECDGLELGLFVDIGRLQDVVRSVEDDEGISGDVGLGFHSISHG